MYILSMYKECSTSNFSTRYPVQIAPLILLDSITEKKEVDSVEYQDADYSYNADHLGDGIATEVAAKNEILDVMENDKKNHSCP